MRISENLSICGSKTNVFILGMSIKIHCARIESQIVKTLKNEKYILDETELRVIGKLFAPLNNRISVIIDGNVGDLSLISQALECAPIPS